MPRYVDTRGKTSVAIGICDRCKFAFPLVDLEADRNSPGLRVCRADNDLYDPYRLPARKSEDISLRYPRPDVDLTFSDAVTTRDSYAVGYAVNYTAQI